MERTETLSRVRPGPARRTPRVDALPGSACCGPASGATTRVADEPDRDEHAGHPGPGVVEHPGHAGPVAGPGAARAARRLDPASAAAPPAGMAEPADLRPTGRLQLFGVIGRGGMGVVLKGHDTDLGRDLAVKVLLESYRDQPELVRRFIEEAQIGGQLQHPGVVPVYELGTFADRRPYIAMKLIKGRTLAELLADGRSPDAIARGCWAIFEVGLPDDGLRARPRRDPPRPEAVEHHGGQLRRGAGDGLGPGQGPDRGRAGVGGRAGRPGRVARDGRSPRAERFGRRTTRGRAA